VSTLAGALVRLRPPTAQDVPVLAQIRRTPEVFTRRWGGDDLVAGHGHHRLVIDPAADDVAAIRSYGKVGFRPVGIMRRYERDVDGTWHDNLLMDLLVDELIE